MSYKKRLEDRMREVEERLDAHTTGMANLLRSKARDLLDEQQKEEELRVLRDKARIFDFIKSDIDELVADSETEYVDYALMLSDYFPIILTRSSL